MSAGFFDALADAQVSSPVKAKLRAHEKRLAARKEGEKKLEDKELLQRLYKAGKRAEIRALMSGAYGKEVRGLIAFMRTMTMSSAPALVRVVEGANWIRDLAPVERSLIESLIFNGIAKLREKNDLTFWEDAMPGEPPKVFDDVLSIVRAA